MQISGLSPLPTVPLTVARKAATAPTLLMVFISLSFRLARRRLLASPSVAVSVEMNVGADDAARE